MAALHPWPAPLDAPGAPAPLRLCRGASPRQSRLVRTSVPVRVTIVDRRGRAFPRPCGCGPTALLALRARLLLLLQRATCRASVPTCIPSPRVTAVVCHSCCVLPALPSPSPSRQGCQALLNRPCRASLLSQQVSVVTFCATEAAVYAPVRRATRAPVRGACPATAILSHPPAPYACPWGSSVHHADGAMHVCIFPPSGERCSAR